MVRSSKAKKTRGYFFIWIGLSLLLFPLVKAEVKAYENRLKIQGVQEQLAGLDLEAIRQKGLAYNQELAQGGRPSLDPFEDEAILLANPLGDWQGEDLVGSIELPKIGIQDPLYIGVSAPKLAQGACVIDGTSLPFGGPGTRSVIAGHRGNYDGPSFLDVDKLEAGDEMILHVLDQALVYQVTSKEIIYPYETEKLQADPTKDQITLLTCHPFPRTTYRLLVNGERKASQPLVEEVEAPDQQEARPAVQAAKELEASIRYRQVFLRVLLVLVGLAWLRVLVQIIRSLRRKA